jgi:hypothetical protein
VGSGNLRAVPVPAISKPVSLFHFSEDPTISKFVPHVPRTNPTHSPAVWAIDEDHAPLYWFPRECPRVTVWPRNARERMRFENTFCTEAPRVHGIETNWLEAMRSTVLFRYTLPAESFVPWPDVSGQWVSEVEVEPFEVLPVGDLLDCHVVARIELRVTPDLWPLHDLAKSDRWDFSIVRMSKAQPRHSTT